MIPTDSSAAGDSERVVGVSGGLAGRVASDGMANLLRFAVSALSVFAVTPVISRTLDHGSFSVWTLVVTISTYIALAEAGATSAVTRFVSTDLVDGTSRTPSILASAFWLLTASATTAVAVLAAIAYGTDWLFGDVPTSLLATARASVLALGVGVGVGIVGIAIQGYFFAIHRAIFPALIAVVVRTSVAAGLLVAVLATKSVFPLALITMAGGVVSTVVIIALVRRRVGTPVLAPSLVRRHWLVEIAKHSSTLIGWSLAMVAITGLDLVVVGAFSFASVGAYGIAAQGVSLMLGLFGAAVAPLTAAAARRHAEGSKDQVGAILLDFSRVAVTLLVVASSILFVAAPWVIRLYAGPSYVAVGAPVLRILLAGNVLRNTCGPLGAVLVATGEHRRVLASPIVEALVNLSLSLWWVHMFGARGVAWATLVGACFGVGLHLVLTLRRTTAFVVSWRSFLLQALGRPALVIVPAAAMSVLESATGFSPVAAIGIAVLSCPTVAWMASLNVGDRTRLRTVARPVLARFAR